MNAVATTALWPRVGYNAFEVPDISLPLADVSCHQRTISWRCSRNDNCLKRQYSRSLPKSAFAQCGPVEGRHLNEKGNVKLTRVSVLHQVLTTAYLSLVAHGGYSFGPALHTKRSVCTCLATDTLFLNPTARDALSLINVLVRAPGTRVRRVQRSHLTS